MQGLGAVGGGVGTVLAPVHAMRAAHGDDGCDGWVGLHHVGYWGVLRAELSMQSISANLHTLLHCSTLVVFLHSALYRRQPPIPGMSTQMLPSRLSLLQYPVVSSRACNSFVQGSLF